jgi:hypothetical protein
MDQENRWRAALWVTFIVVLLNCITIKLVCDVNAALSTVSKKQQEFAKQLTDLVPLLEDNSLEGDSRLSLQKAIFLLNSIERFIRTTPLVECGNRDGRNKEGTVRGSNK